MALRSGLGLATAFMSAARASTIRTRSILMRLLRGRVRLSRLSLCNGRRPAGGRPACDFFFCDFPHCLLYRDAHGCAHVQFPRFLFVFPLAVPRTEPDSRLRIIRQGRTKRLVPCAFRKERQRERRETHHRGEQDCGPDRHEARPSIRRLTPRRMRRLTGHDATLLSTQSQRAARAKRLQKPCENARRRKRALDYPARRAPPRFK